MNSRTSTTTRLGWGRPGFPPARRVSALAAPPSSSASSGVAGRRRAGSTCRSVRAGGGARVGALLWSSAALALHRLGPAAWQAAPALRGSENSGSPPHLPGPGRQQWAGSGPPCSGSATQTPKGRRSPAARLVRAGRCLHSTGAAALFMNAIECRICNSSKHSS